MPRSEPEAEPPEPAPAPTGVMRGLARWLFRARTSVGLLVGAIAGAVGWMLSQASVASNSLEKFVSLSNASRELTEKYATEFKNADPGKSDVLTLVLFRVRTGVFSPEIGQNLLCWLAARAEAQGGDIGATGLTSANIINFMERNSEDFPLQPVHHGWLPPLLPQKRMKARDYCAAYLSFQAKPGAQDDALAGSDPIVAVKQVSVPTGAKAPTPDPAKTASPPPFTGVRFFLQISSEGQRPGAVLLGSDLSALPALAGLSPQGVQRVGSYGGANEVRYYKDRDFDAARTLAAHISCDGRSPSVSKVLGYETNPVVRPQTIELWIGPASPEGCKAVAG
jgi:hypothetical protein